MTIAPRRRGSGPRPPRVWTVLRGVAKSQRRRPQSNKRMRWRKSP